MTTKDLEALKAAVAGTKEWFEDDVGIPGCVQELLWIAQSYLDGTLIEAATEDEIRSIIEKAIFDKNLGGMAPIMKSVLVPALVGKVSSNEVTHTTECIVCGKPSPIMCDECVSKVPKK